jgi:membrane protein DedA with SNARE-associated domain
MGDDVATAFQVLAASSWLLPALFVLCAFDGILPVVPGETAVIAAGVLATTGRPNLAAVIAAAALGSFTGDCLCYLLWRRLRWATVDRVRPGTRRAAALLWAGGLLVRRGGPIILAGRFIPSGRSAVTVAAGTTAFPLRRFLPWDAAAAASWAVYISTLGYFCGRVTGGNPLLGTAVGLGVATLVTLVLAAVRKWRPSPADELTPVG